MAVRLRLRREGTKKRPHYRVVAADKRSPRNGKFIEIIGEYHPLDDPSTIIIDEERAMHWLEHGAQPSDQVKKLLRIVGVWEQFKPDDEPLRDRSTDKPKLSKKAKAKLAADKDSAAEAAAEKEAAAEEPVAGEPAAEEPVAEEEPEAAASDETAADATAADEPEAAADEVDDEVDDDDVTCIPQSMPQTSTL